MQTLNEVTISKAIISRYLEKLQAALELDVAIVGGGPSCLVAGYYLIEGTALAWIERPQLAQGLYLILSEPAAGYQALARMAVAAGLPVDYIGFGPLYPTATKADPDPVIGLGPYLEARRICPHPVVAIGGLNPARLARLGTTACPHAAMAEARKALDWNRQIALALSPAKAGEYRRQSDIKDAAECTMCGEYCAIKQLGAFNSKC